MQSTNATSSDLIENPVTQTSSESVATEDAQTGYRVIRRNGKVTSFDGTKIKVAMTKAFLAVEGGQAAASGRVHEIVDQLTAQVEESLVRRTQEGRAIHIEDIQDQVELTLMRAGEHKVARDYVLYRARQAEKRAEEEIAEAVDTSQLLHIVTRNGERQPLNEKRITALIAEATHGLDGTDAALIRNECSRNIYDGMSEQDLRTIIVMSARGLIDRDPQYSNATARLLMDNMRHEALTFLYPGEREATQTEMTQEYGDYFKLYLTRGIELELIDPRLADYDLEKLTAALKPENDQLFTYLGLQTLYDRYFIHNATGTRFELPQAFFMRVAMGLAINETERETRTIEFYNLLSSFDFMSSTPTLFNSATLRPQLSSCYLTTIPDDLDGIFSAIKDDAMLSKFAGGLGNDWTPVRGMGAHIKGTNGASQGVVPFLKVANDTAVAVNQGGKRKGAMCAYLETWHIDVEEFIELRKNTGDERRRTHDMNTANWIPDLFMERVTEDKEWTLFSPDEVPDLHDLTGQAFREQYEAYEEKAARGEFTISRTLKAQDLWRKMLGMLFETGHPWITFKDPCNIRYSNQHVGVVHSSNLCTEIMLHTNADEIAVCNLGSVNMAAHVDENGLNVAKLKKTIATAMRMLDNVIDYNYYSVPQARKSNLQHRPVGLGIMGFQDALYKLNIPYASTDAIEFADTAMEAVSYYAIQGSTDLAEERGSYDTFEGSLWSQGILPIDSIQDLYEGRGKYIDIDRSKTMDWDSLRNRVKDVGMRNSNTMAIAPTATISNICGVSQSIEPTYQNLYVKSNLSGEFTVVNPYLVNDLKDRGLWDDVMINDLKYYDGSAQKIDRIPEELKEKYATAFEIDSRWLIECASRRQKWIDQGQSLNLYLAEPSGKALDNLYKLAWVRGLKTTYYLRSLGATHVEKSTTTPDESQKVEAPAPKPAAAPKACSILDPDCDACQ